MFFFILLILLPRPFHRRLHLDTGAGRRLRDQVLRHQARRLGRQLQLKAFNDVEVNVQKIEIPRRHRSHLYRSRAQE